MISAAADASRARRKNSTTGRPVRHRYKLHHMTSVQLTGRGALGELLGLIEGLPRSERPVGAGACVLARHVRAWIADPAQGVVSTGGAVDGAEAPRIVLTSLAPSELTLAACVATQPTCWA